MLSGVLLILLFTTKAFSDVTVTLPDGIIAGLEKTSLRNRTFQAFLRVPYAQPPLGNLRFKDPEPVKPWKGTLNATTETSICYQTSSNSDLESEDCLYLNVYTPVGTSNTINLLPVMFFIHGGGFLNGYSLYSRNGPQHFMDNDVVVVTIAYRLGPFGFLSTQDSVIPGNYGLKDQTMALKWVQKNIAYFGGDPNKVTIFGQSSGAVSVGYHIISPQSKGLFRGAIQQSGSVLTPHGYQRRAKSFAYTLAKYIDPTFSDDASSEELLSFLQKATAKQIDTATESFTQAPGSTILNDGSWFAPVIEEECDHAFITKNMFEYLECGDINKVPLMIGITSEETVGQASDLVKYKENIAQYDNNVTFLVPADMHIEDLANKTAAGEAIRDIYVDGLLQDNLGAAVRYSSDAYVSRPVIKHAELQAVHTDVFFYQFSYDGELGGNDVYVEGAGNVSHSEDMRYLWVFDDSSDIAAIDDQDLKTLDRYVKMFTNFAKTLNPTPEPDSLLDKLTWSLVTSDSFKYLDIGEHLTIKRNPKAPEYKKWVDVYEKMAIKPYDTF